MNMISISFTCTYCNHKWNIRFGSSEREKDYCQDVQCMVCKDKNIKIIRYKPLNTYPIGSFEDDEEYLSFDDPYDDLWR